MRRRGGRRAVGHDDGRRRRTRGNLRHRKEEVGSGQGKDGGRLESEETKLEGGRRGKEK